MKRLMRNRRCSPRRSIPDASPWGLVSLSLPCRTPPARHPSRFVSPVRWGHGGRGRWQVKLELLPDLTVKDVKLYSLIHLSELGFQSSKTPPPGHGAKGLIKSSSGQVRPGYQTLARDRRKRHTPVN